MPYISGNLQGQGGQPCFTTHPSITGTPGVGQVLTGNPGACAAPTPTLSYAWLKDGLPIVGATALTYTPVAADSTHHIAFQVKAFNGFGTTQQSSTPVTVA
jgi:hypothetical protein